MATGWRRCRSAPHWWPRLRWRRLMRVGKRVNGHVHEAEVKELEPFVDVHSFTPGDLEGHATQAGLQDVRVAGEELTCSLFGWFNRALEATAEPDEVPHGWSWYAYGGYMALRRMDTTLLEPVLPPALFYNLMISARAPSAMSFEFWVRWLLAGTVLAAAFGLVMVFAPGVTEAGFGLMIFGSPGPPPGMDSAGAAYVRFAYGVLGAVMFGWMLMAALVVNGPFRSKEPWAWKALALSLGAWFVVDTAHSLLSGFWQNAVLNVGVRAGARSPADRHAPPLRCLPVARDTCVSLNA